jgi:hypothetical protein
MPRGAAGAAAVARRSARHYLPLVPYLKKFLAEDLSYAEMSRELNRMGAVAMSGREFTKDTVWFVVARLKRQGHL